jgi:hypothetical protein
LCRPGSGTRPGIRIEPRHFGVQAIEFGRLRIDLSHAMPLQSLGHLKRTNAIEVSPELGGKRTESIQRTALPAELIGLERNGE